ncbi:MAG: hypothetical protein H3C34_07275 [Caldilineaceae bacterium]|nr:hypothetical protein [Caldilineaceae bacterium]
MTDATLFGIPLVIWGVICAAIAAAYFFIWPRPHPKRAKPRPALTHLVLRYGHTLVWALLATGCFLAAADTDGPGRWIASAAIPVYLAFLVFLVRDKQQEAADLAQQRTASKQASPE